jgi:hypothetical protein
MKIRTMKLPADLDRKVSANASRRRVSRSAVVREALAAYLTGPRADSDSFADQAVDLAGCVSGPADLSTNASRLEGYGRSRR